MLYGGDIDILFKFNNTIQTWRLAYNHKFKKMVNVVDKCYAIKMHQKATYGYHANLLSKFLTHLKEFGIQDSEIEYTSATIESPDKVLTPLHVELALKPEYNPRDHQPHVIDHILSSEGILGRITVASLQMGQGKTYCTLYSISKVGIRASITTAPRYIQSWIDDIAKFYENDKSCYRLISTTKEFKKLIDDGKRGKLKNLAIIIIPNTILRPYFKEYEIFGKSTYGCDPEELYQTLGVCWRVTDEAHEDIHFQFRHDIHTNVHKHVCLSATLKSHDSFTNKLYEILYPSAARLQGVEWKKYIIGVALGYKLESPDEAKYMGAKGYSHNEYEQWIMSDTRVKLNYFKMITSLTERCFIKKYQPGQRFLVYFASKDMIYAFTEYLSEHISMQDLRIAAYTDNDPPEIPKENDILISTPNKSGTGKDIYGLIAILNTVSMHTMQGNSQMSGRIREHTAAMFPGSEPMFYYLVCTDIRKQKDYHESKVDQFADEFKELRVFNTNLII
jgi:hypothetical protein